MSKKGDFFFLGAATGRHDGPLALEDRARPALTDAMLDEAMVREKIPRSALTALRPGPISHALRMVIAGPLLIFGVMCVAAAEFIAGIRFNISE